MKLRLVRLKAGGVRIDAEPAGGGAFIVREYTPEEWVGQLQELFPEGFALYPAPTKSNAVNPDYNGTQRISNSGMDMNYAVSIGRLGDPSALVRDRGEEPSKYKPETYYRA